MHVWALRVYASTWAGTIMHKHITHICTHAHSQAQGLVESLHEALGRFLVSTHLLPREVNQIPSRCARAGCRAQVCACRCGALVCACRCGAQVLIVDVGRRCACAGSGCRCWLRVRVWGASVRMRVWGASVGCGSGAQALISGVRCRHWLLQVGGLQVVVAGVWRRHGLWVVVTGVVVAGVGFKCGAWAWGRGAREKVKSGLGQSCG